MVTAVPAVTDLVVIAKVAVVAPAATVTEAGRVAALILLFVSATTAPPAGAAAPSVTVPLVDAPPITVAGFSATEVGAAGTDSFTKPSFPPTFAGCRASTMGKFTDPV